MDTEEGAAAQAAEEVEVDENPPTHAIGTYMHVFMCVCVCM